MGALARPGDPASGRCGGRMPGRSRGGCSERGLGQLGQLQRLLGEPGPGRWVDDAPLGVDAAVVGQAARALAVGLTGHLDPEERVSQRVAGVGRGAQAEAAVGWVAPVLRVRVQAGRRRPRALAVAAGVDDEVREVGGATGWVRRVGDVVEVPLVGRRRVVVAGGRVVLAGALLEVAEPRAALRGVGAVPEALRDPVAVLQRARRRAVVRDVEEEPVGPCDPARSSRSAASPTPSQALCVPSR